MAYTSAQLEALDKAIAGNVLTVANTDASGNRTQVTYRSMDELIRARDLIRRELGVVGTTPGAGGFSVSYFRGGKGL